MTKLEDVKRVHLIGIGGCSMNGLAMILKAKGYQVQGSDREESPFTERLKKEGIDVYIGHRKENLGDAQLVIYSSAIGADNPERQEAMVRGMPQVPRAEALGQISAHYSTVVGIAGCHGKTTITSMLATIVQQGALDATVHVGGFVDCLSGGTHIGSDELFVTEACEYVESFLFLYPTMALVNNIDDDHLDYYHDMAHIVRAFERFVALLPPNGVLFGCRDDAHVQALMQKSPCRTVSYGKEHADYTPVNISYDADGHLSFDVLFLGEPLGTIHMQMPGMHNVIDALGAIAVARELHVPFDAIAQALASYQLTRRRLEYYGERNGVTYYHDYAHHPGEIRAVLEAASHLPHNRLFCVFQCNSFTRAKTLFTNDVTCFHSADAVLVTDIYPGREVDTGLVHARDMVDAIGASGVRVLYTPSFQDVHRVLDELAQPGDLVLTLGSGNVYKQSRILLECS